LLKLLSRAGYRPLLEAGVRVFEWNGPMIHAKTAVADGHWARVGSTNLNISSWLNNCELDVFVEDEAFAREMEEMFRQDLQNATEIVLNARRRISVPPRPLRRNSHGGGSVGRATAGAIRIGNAVGAAFTDRRVLEPIESRLTAIAGAVFLVLAALIAIFPRVFAGVLLVLLLWLALAMLTRSFRLRRAAKKKRRKKRS
ncbi:MAG TPA: phospholipase D-like domain-containing protein, partial [Candidatus Aminicenantes bacterium]|nr:phospholipase D-like domain-containing protein [Candidatus Aminicenantes bacterium]